MMSTLNFITILFIGFLDYAGIALVYPIFAAMLFDPAYPLFSYEAPLAMRGALLGVLIGLTPMTQFLSAPILGSFSDRKGRKKTLLYGTLIGAFAYCLALCGVWMHSISLLLFYRILIGLSSGTVPVAQALIADISTEENKARRFSLFNASLGFGFTVGPFFGGKLAEFGYATPFIGACVMCFLSYITILWKFSETHQESKNVSFDFLMSLRNIQKVFLWRQLHSLFLSTFAFAFGWSFFNEFIPILVRQKFGFSLSDIGNYYAYGGAWYALCCGFISAAILKYMPAEQIAVKALIGSAACMLSFLFFEEQGFIWFLLPLLMLCISFTFPTTAAMVSNRAGAENQGEVLGVYHSVIGFAMGISPILVGPIIGMYPAFVAIGGAFAMLLAGFAFNKGIKNDRLRIRKVFDL